MGVLLSQIARDVPGLRSFIGADAEVVDITHDSRQVRAGSLFVAIRGEHHDGHDYLKQAIDQGACGLLVDEPHDLGVPQIVVGDTRRAMPWAARAVFSAPDGSVDIVGVTGTNGKTTVGHMLESIARVAGVPAGIIGTIGIRINGRPIKAKRTTPEATDLQRLLRTMADDGVNLVVMEVSSHAIELHRTDAIHFAAMGFTNLSRDHLDFHSDMESYFETKSRVFAPGVTDVAVVNVEDDWGARLADGIDIRTVTSSTTRGGDVRATEVVPSARRTRFLLLTPQGAAHVDLPLVGSFNVENALVATGLALELGLQLSAVVEGLGTLAPIPGRMEVVPHSGSFTVLVDYAHTPDAIAVVLGSVRSSVSGDLIAVVGAGGDRDREKRSLMGAAAARLSDRTIITTDNPRSEDPDMIAQEVRRGAQAQPGAFTEIIGDRRDAIAHAVAVAKPGDAVLILGKGHEQGQDMGTEVLPFDDRQVAREVLAEAGLLSP